MNLTETLNAIAQQLNLNAVDMGSAARMDNIGGYHPDGRLQRFPSGSVWEVEGQTLYALVRATGAKRVMELGTYYGCSAEHLAEALADNGGGELVCVDRAFHARTEILEKRFQKLGVTINFVEDDALDYIKRPHKPFDFIFDDLSHVPADVAHIWQWARDHLAPGGLIVSHDALHFRIGVDVRTGIEQVVKDARYYLTEPSDCGLAIWQKPAQAAPIKTMQTEQEKPGDSLPLAAPQKPTFKRKSKGR